MDQAPVSLERLEMQRIILSGGVPDPANPPTECAFHPRCRAAKDACGQMVPELVRWVVGMSCHVTSGRYIGLAGGQGRSAFFRQSVAELAGVVL